MIPSGSAWLATDTANCQLGLEVLGATIPPYEPRRVGGQGRRTLGTYGLVGHIDGVSFFESELCRQTDIKEFAVFVLFPGVWHYYGAKPSTPWTECWTLFRGELMDRLVEKGVFSPARAVILGLPKAKTIRAFDRLGHAVRDTVVQDQPQPTAAALFELLSIMALHAPSPVEVSSPIEKAVSFLREHVAEAIHPEDLARHVGLSYISFRKRFKAHTGISPHQYLINLRVQRAGQLLTGTSLTVSEIAGALGFDDPYYFSRLFKRKTGQAPLHFRDAAATMLGRQTGELKKR